MNPEVETPRMQSFMERYLDAHRTDEHRVAIQLMRNTLMHTGALRYLYEKRTETAYTWHQLLLFRCSRGRVDADRSGSMHHRWA